MGKYLLQGLAYNMCSKNEGFLEGFYELYFIA